MSTKITNFKEVAMNATRMKQYRAQYKNNNIVRGKDHVSGYEAIVMATDQDLD